MSALVGRTNLRSIAARTTGPVELASMTTATLRQNRLAELAAEKRAELKAAVIALP